MSSIIEKAHNFKPTSKKLIKETNGYILDVGGGERKYNHSNYVNIDVVKNKFVNIVADAHNLPIRNEVISVIICEAVLEHLRKPWLASKEFYRVLKKFGYVYADVSFLMPMHAFPNHYFNATLEGNKVLFEDFLILASGVQDYQMPSYALTSILSHYVRTFIPMIREKADTTVVYDSSTKGLMVRLYKIIRQFFGIFDKFLDDKTIKCIATGTYILAQKK